MKRNDLISIECIFCLTANNIYQINISRAKLDTKDFIRLDGSIVGKGKYKGPTPSFVNDLGNIAKDFIHRYQSLVEANAKAQRRSDVL